LENTIIGAGVTSWGNYQIFYNCSGELVINSNIRGEFAVPVSSTSSKYYYYGLFKDSKFSKVVIGDNVTYIGNRAFNGCSSINTLTIGRAVASIGEYAFATGSNAINVYCKMVVPSVLNGAVFDTTALIYVYDESCKLFKIEWGNYSDNIIPNGANKDIDLHPTSIIKYTTIDDRILEIDFDSYYVVKSHTYSDNGGELEIYDGGQYILKTNVFNKCTALTSISIPDTISNIQSSAFSGCENLVSVVLPSTITSIADYTFYQCGSLMGITIPDSVKTIGSYAFDACVSLTSIIIPDGVTRIGGYAFAYCYDLKDVYCKPLTPPTGGSDMFYYNASGRNIDVSTDSVEAYKKASYWKNYASYINTYTF
jgi:hypothetical protein